MWNQQIDEKIPNWVNSKVQINELEDESQVFQVGFSQDYTFHDYSHFLPQPSSWNKFPTKEDPSRRYKFTSLEVNMSLDKLVVNRESYSLLDWLGDLGGLFDALRIICLVLIYPVSTFSLQSTLMSKLFRQRPSDHSLKKNDFN